jgi:hypothetical protein
LLTTAQLRREISQLKDLLNLRLDQMDKAVTLVHEARDKMPARVDEKIAALQAVQDVKFESIQIQFKERDVRVEQSSKDAKVAVDAALQAAKEAVEKQNTNFAQTIGKSDAGTTKQIDQMNVLIDKITSGLNDKISDIKDRLGRGEGVGEGKHDSSAFMFAIVAALVSMGSLIAAVVIAFRK